MARYPHLFSLAVPRVLTALALLLVAGGTQAATPPVEPAPPVAGIEPRSERILHEDALTRVDVLRVGGQTRSITVQTKSGAPAYEVVPLTGSADPHATRNGSNGKSRWRLFDF